jgi:hypothetical protein
MAAHDKVVQLQVELAACHKFVFEDWPRSVKPLPSLVRSVDDQRACQKRWLMRFRVKKTGWKKTNTQDGQIVTLRVTLGARFSKRDSSRLRR